MHPRPWRTVTEEWIRRFGDGAGDYNPLYRDPRHVSGRYLELIASPAFVFSVDFGANASIWGHIPQSDVSTKDLTMLYLGASLEWYRPIYVGDRIRSVETPAGIRRTSTRQIGEACVCTGVTEYWNSRGELVARLTNEMLRFANPGEGVEAATASARPAGGVAPDPLVWERTRRGAEPRYWESVSAGDKLPDLPKGTYTVTELYLFAHAALNTRRSRAVDEGTIDMGAGGRADPEYARRNRAQATTFDYGPQRICWMIQAVTDWMGDHGDLLRIDTRLRRPNLVGDMNTVQGTVKRTYRDGGDLLAEIDLVNVNQEDVVTAGGTATVRLPAEGTVPTPAPLFAEERQPAPGIYG
ncbi:FAS1-like dehydratase domain-containing protein [Thermocatellispora tengchongensis]|uniref:FAS1-like dehydratase domain-containing protein n=1 Tax=Thermocatellispora tengchongensis TaxID=1073253 RepID=UPI00363A70A5